MTIKSSGSSLAFSEIEAEFGANGSRSLGAYRVSQVVGELTLPLDVGIPSSGQIKFSDFYSKSLNVVVDMHSGSTEFRKSARSDKWNNNQVTVVGGFRSKKESGSKIIIHINKKFGSDKSQVENCAVKTGSWSAASVQVDVGGEGEVLGAGGDGGKGADGAGADGEGRADVGRGPPREDWFGGGGGASGWRSGAGGGGAAARCHMGGAIVAAGAGPRPGRGGGPIYYIMNI